MVRLIYAIFQGIFMGCALHGSVALAQTSSVPGVFSDRILFGQSAKMSGSGGTQAGRQYRDGLMLAFGEANRGGVHGRRIELITLDDENTSEKAKANTLNLIEKHRVFALIGHTFTDPVRAVLPIVREARIPLIAPYVGFAEAYDGTQRDVFMMRASFANELSTLVRHIDTVRYERVALVHYKSTVGEQFKVDLSEELRRVKRELVTSTTMAQNSSDPAAAAQPPAEALAQNCPKVIVLAVSGRDAAALVRAMKGQRCPPARYLARGLVDITLLMRELGEEARGIMVTQVVPNPFRDTHPLVRDYRHLLQQRDASAVPDFTEFEGYIAGRFTVQALRRAGAALDRAKFVQALEAERLDGPGHYRLQFGPGKRQASQYVNIVMIADQGRISD